MGTRPQNRLASTLLLDTPKTLNENDPREVGPESLSSNPASGPPFEQTMIETGSISGHDARPPSVAAPEGTTTLPTVGPIESQSQDDLRQRGHDARLPALPSVFGGLVGDPTLASECATPMPAPDPLWPVIEGYTIRSKLGSAGMGEVFRARDLGLDRDVALKVPRLATRNVEDLFLTEAQSLAKVKHPHVVPIHAFGRCGGHVYFTMDLIDGPNAGDLVRSFGSHRAHKLSVARLWNLLGLDPAKASGTLRAAGTSRRKPYYAMVATWMAEAAEGLHAAHEAKILHRDIKPNNLLLNRDGRMMVVDFGLAKHSRDIPDVNGRGLSGTPPYMAPERAVGDWARVDHRADIWALGATLYEFLTYRRAYPRDGKEVLVDITTKEPTRPRSIVKKVPKGLEDICLRAMRKDISQRYTSALEMAAELRKWAAKRPAPNWAKWVGFVIGLTLAVGLIPAINQGRVKDEPIVKRHEPKPAVIIPENVEDEPNIEPEPAISPNDSPPPPAEPSPEKSTPQVAAVAPIVLLAFTEDLNTSDDKPARNGGAARAKFQDAIEKAGWGLVHPASSPGAFTQDSALQDAIQLGANVLLLGSFEAERNSEPTVLSDGTKSYHWRGRLDVRVMDPRSRQVAWSKTYELKSNRPEADSFDGFEELKRLCNEKQGEVLSQIESAVKAAR